MDRTEQLKSMLQDIINDRTDQAEVTLHDYFVAKTRDVAGFASPEVEEPVSQDDE
jgi:hypothetical protein